MSEEPSTKSFNPNETHVREEDRAPNLAEPEANGLRPVLMIFDQHKLHEWYMIVQKTTTIGREPDVDIFLDDDTISRHHSHIIFENIDRPTERPVCVLVDNKSRNGTFLNGKKILAPTVLKNGDRVFVGGTCLAFFVRTELEINSDQKLRSLATTDALTGLVNRGYMAIQFQKEFDRSRRYERPLSLLMIDLDNFKKVNDTYGHQIGDQTLESVARILSSRSRIHDICARYGGEEFAVLLPETDLAGAKVIADRLRKAIEGHEFITRGPRIRCTVSIGVADLAGHSRGTMEEMIAAADKALLRAKSEGKNRLCVAESGNNA